MQNNIYDKLLQISNNTSVDTNTSTCNPIKTLLDSLAGECGKCYSTGFENIDSMIKGGLKPQTLTILAAQTGMGKTTLSLQMAYHISKTYKKDVLYLAFEMSAFQLYLKLLSMLTKDIHDRCVNAGGKPWCVDQILEKDGWPLVDRDTQGLLIRAAEELQNNTNLYIKSHVDYVTPEDVRKMVEDHITATGNEPIVFIDYLHNISSKKTSATAKQVIDDAIEMLKILSHKYEIPIVAMSSLNRMSYSDPDLASVKGSGDIEYTASTVFLLSDVDAEKKTPPKDLSARTSSRSCRDMSRTRTLRITAAKNRMGSPNISTVLRFNEEYNHFQEIQTGGNR